MTNDLFDSFIIHAYSRSEAIQDGEQIDVTKSATEAGIRFPVFLSRSVFETYVTVPPDVLGQDEAGRLWDIVWMTRCAIKQRSVADNRISVELYVRNDNGAPKLVQLVAACGPLDIDDERPAITITMPGED